MAVPRAWPKNTAAHPQDTLSAFFYKLKKKRYEPMATWGTETSTSQLWQGCNILRQQMTRNCISTEIGSSGTRRKCWNGTDILMQVPMHGPGGKEVPGKETKQHME